jgi:hypothetical protein
MKTQHTDTAGQQSIPLLPAQSRRNRWLAGMGAIIVVMLVVGLSALVFAQLKQHQADQAAVPPPTAQWKQVLKGYTLTSLIAAHSDPAIVYACAVREAQNSSSQSNASTILRSADFGDHWIDIGASDVPGSTCQLAINSVNSNEIYAAGYGNETTNHVVLKHSQDGGKTWETIQPVIHDSSIQTPISWAVQHMQVVGNHLFGMQWIIPRALPVGPPIKSIPYPYLVPRLATSADGGHNWTIIDNQLASQRLGVQSYAIDSSNSNTIYDLVGSSLGPGNLRTVPTYDPLPIGGLSQELFKTTDGGATWQSVLKNIAYGSHIQLAAVNPQVIYVGGTIGPLPLIPGVAQQSYPVAIGSFHLQMSTDGGSSWKNIVIPSDMQSVQNWFVNPAGQVYASPTITFSGQPTAIAGTVVPSSPVPFPTPPPQSNVPPGGADVSRPSPMYRPASFIGLLTRATQIAPSQSIRRYDPKTSSWSDVTNPPTRGYMLQLTSTQSASGAVLWFVGMADNGHVTVYRYVV